MALLKKGSPIALIEVTLVVNNQICIRSVFSSKVWLAELSLRDRMMSMDIWKELRDVEMKQLGCPIYWELHFGGFLCTPI